MFKRATVDNTDASKTSKTSKLSKKFEKLEKLDISKPKQQFAFDLNDRIRNSDSTIDFASLSIIDEDEAQFEIAENFLKNALDAPDNPSKSIMILETLTKTNYAPAQNLLGVQYLLGLYVPYNPEYAFQLFAKAHSKKNLKATLNLASCYMEGDGVAQDKKIGVELLQSLVDIKYPPAQNNLGYCYLYGDGIDQNPIEGFKLITIAAEQNDLHAFMNLYFCYMDGVGTPVDKQKAMHYLKLSAEGGVPLAQNLVGTYHFSGDEGFEINHPKAFSYFKGAAIQGQINAEYNLAICYWNGFGTDKNQELAIYYFKLAASQGDKDSQNMLNALNVETGLKKEIEKKSRHDSNQVLYNFSVNHKQKEFVDPITKDIFPGIEYDVRITTNLKNTWSHVAQDFVGMGSSKEGEARIGLSFGDSDPIITLFKLQKAKGHDFIPGFSMSTGHSCSTLIHIFKTPEDNYSPNHLKKQEIQRERMVRGCNENANWVEDDSTIVRSHSPEPKV